MLKLYRFLLNLYPAAFREEYAKAMEQDVRNELFEAPGTSASVRLWCRLLLDLAVSLPVQLALEVWGDSKHAVRLWARRPWHTGLAIITLGVAIGANTGVFSVVNALLLRPLPFRDPGRLATMSFFIPPHDSAQQFDSWREQSNYLQDAALVEDGDANLGDPQHILRAHVAMTSSNFFSLLGAQPALGRAFAASDRAAAVISYGMWQSLYAGSDRVLGKTVHLYGLGPQPDQSLTIIGVMPVDFDYPANTLLWKTPEYSRGNNGWTTIGRLKAGVPWAQARAAFAADIHRLDWHREPGVDRLLPLQEALAGRVKNASLLLMAGVVLTVLIACANLANFTIGRTLDRLHELSIRSAMGASRARLMQQVLTECFLLAAVSAALGLVVALWAASVANTVEPAQMPSQAYRILDARVLAFLVGLAMASAVIFGLLPALTVGRIHSFMARGSGELSSSRKVRDLLVSAQIALTIVLATASVSVVRALSHQLHMDRGFKTDGLVTASVSLAGTVRDRPGQRLEYFEEVLDRLQHVPGVRNASATEFLPLLSGRFLGGPYAFDGHRSTQGTGADMLPVMAGYFETTGGHVLYGREFTDAEVRSNAKVVIVNETFARIWLQSSDAVGHVVTGPDGTPRTIVGVVRNLDFMGQYVSEVFDVDPPETFVPDYSPGRFDSTFVVNVAGRPDEHAAAIRAAVESVDPGVPVYAAEAMQQRMDRAFAHPKFYRTALIFFSSFALLLALMGIYAAVSFSVSQRTREMGVRLALGTTPTRLRMNFMRHGLAPVVLGTAAGIACATGAGRLLRSLVEGAKPLDISGYSAASICVGLCAAISIWTATRRIARLDVMEILRTE
jgi:putative ABC transport system permease protein